MTCHDFFMTCHQLFQRGLSQKVPYITTAVGALTHRQTHGKSCPNCITSTDDMAGNDNLKSYGEKHYLKVKAEQIKLSLRCV